MQQQTISLIKKYYDAFNRNDKSAFFDLLTDDIAHEINQGNIEIGKEKFQAFLTHMDRCYQEAIENIVIFANEDGTRAAAEFTVTGKYLVTDNGFPEAHQQIYHIPAGAFFDIKNQKIARVTTYYNVKKWIQEITS